MFQRQRDMADANVPSNIPVFEVDCGPSSFFEPTANKLKSAWLQDRTYKHIAIVDLKARGKKVKARTAATRTFYDTIEQWVPLFISRILFTILVVVH